MDWNIVNIAVILILMLWMNYYVKHYLPKYFDEKGKNLATKEDIDEITRKVESIKADIALGHTILQTRYKLKYDALLKSLELVDAHCSHLLLQEGKPIKKQFLTTEDARKCLDEMILTIRDENVLRTLVDILSYDKATSPLLIKLLNKYRNLVRKELEFGDNIELDEKKAFIAQVICDPKIESDKNESK